MDYSVFNITVVKFTGQIFLIADSPVIKHSPAMIFNIRHIENSWKFLDLDIPTPATTGDHPYSRKFIHIIAKISPFPTFGR